MSQPHLRTWVDAHGFISSDTCGCEVDEDHDVKWPEHVMAYPVGSLGEDWESFPCHCEIGRDHDKAGRFAN